MIKSVYKLDKRIKDVSDIQSPVHYDVSEDFKEILEKLKQLDINISSLMFYDCDEIEGNDCELVYNTREYIKKCIKNIESLGFLRDKML